MFRRVKLVQLVFKALKRTLHHEAIFLVCTNPCGTAQLGARRLE